MSLEIVNKNNKNEQSGVLLPLVSEEDRMEPAVSVVLDRVFFSALQHGTSFETGDLRGLKSSRKPVLWLKAVPTAGGILAAADTNLHNTTPGGSVT